MIIYKLTKLNEQQIIKHHNKKYLNRDFNKSFKKYFHIVRYNKYSSDEYDEYDEYDDFIVNIIKLILILILLKKLLCSLNRQTTVLFTFNFCYIYY